MEPDEDDIRFFQYAEDEDGASLITNMTDEEVTEVLAQFIQRDNEGRLH